MNEYTCSITRSNGGTEALVISACSKQDAIERIARMYRGARINWII